MADGIAGARRDAEQAAAIAAGFAAPPMPSTSSEYITALAHFHRAEIARMAGWRDRIDRTTNWAITGGGAMLSLSLSTPASHHGVLIFTMGLMLLFLMIEARRYRFFDVYRARVRLIERNYFAPLFIQGQKAEADWSQALGDSLHAPSFQMSFGQAMGRRLRRNYIWIFLIVLFAWVLKISSPRMQQTGTLREAVVSFNEILANARLGPVPGWLILATVAAFYAWLIYNAMIAGRRQGALAQGDAHV